MNETPFVLKVFRSQEWCPAEFYYNSAWGSLHFWLKHNNPELPMIEQWVIHGLPSPSVPIVCTIG
jgi:hypothetical protein